MFSGGRKYILALVIGVTLGGGCTPVARHEVLTTIFDGVPSLPPADQFCKDYAADAVAKLREEAEGKKRTEGAGQGSVHRPYEDKECSRCHDQTTASGFVVASKSELCYHCHKNFIKGSWVHGPVAVKDCLFCHDPHSSANPYLLKESAATICNQCHREGRQAASMHKKVAVSGIICTNCHNPHYGNVHFFLK